jgi:EAL domain-containing protein (putative c-di-GMP-specific phosphodiesterase class I)
MGQIALDRIRIQNDLYQAVDEEQFVLAYQPIIDVYSGRIKGMEALVRWNHPTEGILMPGRFIGIAEQSGIIIKIGYWVLKAACSFARDLYNRGYRDFYISVNVSSTQLLQPDFVNILSETLKKADIEPKHLIIEITESVLVESFDNVVGTLLKIRQLGLEIALDDFGCGYSSLTYLKQLPIDVLKIDKSFVDDILSTTDEKCIMGSIITLAQILGLKVIAEGVETNEQLSYLKRHTCDLFQGYLVSKPVFEEKIIELLLSEQS